VHSRTYFRGYLAQYATHTRQTKLSILCEYCSSCWCRVRAVLLRFGPAGLRNLASCHSDTRAPPNLPLRISHSAPARSTSNNVESTVQISGSSAIALLCGLSGFWPPPLPRFCAFCCRVGKTWWYRPTMEDRLADISANIPPTCVQRPLIKCVGYGLPDDTIFVWIGGGSGPGDCEESRWTGLASHLRYPCTKAGIPNISANI
jgi:hypothetical protein